MSRKNLIKAFLIIVVVGLVVYFNSLFNNFVWEDFGQLVNNPIAQNVTNIPTFFMGGTYYSDNSGVLIGNLYRPLMVVYFSIVTTLFGLNPFAFHLLQVLIHVANSYLVFLFLKKFLKSKTSFFMALIFLVHPINTETVSYISIVNDPLYFLFGMLGLLALDKSILLSAIFLSFSMFSKESGIMFVTMSFFYSYFFNKRIVVKTFISGILVSAVYIWARMNLLHADLTNTGYFPMERMPLLGRLSLMPAIIVFYFLTYFLPINLSVARQWTAVNFASAGFLIPTLVLIFIVLAFTLIFFKLIEGNKRKTFLFFVIWIIVGFLLYIQVYPQNMTVAERWFLFAQVGLLGCIGLVIDKYFKAKHIKYVFYVIILILAILSVRTIIRNMDWQSDKTLFSHDIKVSPDSYMIQEGLGIVNVQEGDLDEARLHMKNAFHLFPFDYTVVSNLRSVNSIRKEESKSGVLLDQYPKAH